MFKSVYFPEEGKGYIYDKPEKPIKPDRWDRRFEKKTDDWDKPREIDEEKYKAALDEYKKELNYYNKHKNDFVLPCSKYLVGKKFDFEDHKINIIFGPNGCGKSTILKTLSGTALIDHYGMTKKLEPLDFGWGDDKNNISVILDKYKHNSSVVEWDGTPAYSYNPDALRTINTASFGYLAESLFNGDMGTEAAYHVYGNRLSGGQLTEFVVGQILSVCSKKFSIKDMLAPLQKCLDVRRGNSTWLSCYKSELDYLKSFEGYDKVCTPTLLFDEIDKSIDIPSVIQLYSEFLPKILELFDTQIMVVSHNPLILSKNILGKGCYNLISVVPEYTESVFKTLKEIEF